MGVGRERKQEKLYGFCCNECREWSRPEEIRQEGLPNRPNRGTRRPIIWRRRALVRVYRHPPPHHHRDSARRNTDMDSVSKRFKRLKHRFKERRHKREGGSRSDSRGRGEDDNEASETGQSSHLPPEAKDMAESRPGREKEDGDDRKVVQVDPPTSAPSISPGDGGKLNGTRSTFL